MRIICSFIASILEEVNLVNKLIIFIMGLQREEDMSHEFDSQKKAEVLILYKDSRML